MKRRTIIILVSIVIVNVLVLFSLSHWRTQRQKQFTEELRDAQRYAGATGPTITAFDNRTNRWIAEMKEETIEITLLKLTDAGEYFWVGSGKHTMPVGLVPEEMRQKTVYATDIKDILANRRFRKALDDIKKTDKKKVAELLTKNIRENLAELHILLQEYRNTYFHGGSKYPEIVHGVPDDNFYRLSYYHPDRPPTHYARRYAVLSYLLLASYFELQEVRPAVEEVIQFANEEFEFFSSIDIDKAFTFKATVLYLSLYRPSLLMTATLCDPKWNTEKRKALATKLTTKEIVDWESRALEQDHDAVLGLVPVVPHEKMLKIRYYEGITEAELDDFFGK